MTSALADNGDTLAHVVEQLVIAEHYSAGHGPQLGAPRPPLHACDTQPCPTWRRYLAGRLP